MSDWTPDEDRRLLIGGFGRPDGYAVTARDELGRTEQEGRDRFEWLMQSQPDLLEQIAYANAQAEEIRTANDRTFGSPGTRTMTQDERLSYARRGPPVPLDPAVRGAAPPPAEPAPEAAPEPTTTPEPAPPPPEQPSEQPVPEAPAEALPAEEPASAPADAPVEAPAEPPAPEAPPEGEQQPQQG